MKQDRINHRKYEIYWYNQIKLVSSKNIYNWISYSQKMARMPILGHTFFGLYLAMFGLKIFMGTQKTIIYQIDMMLIFSFDFFGPFLAGNWLFHHARPLWIGASKSDQKGGQLGGPFGSTTISNSCFFGIFRGEPPLKY